MWELLKFFVALIILYVVATNFGEVMTVVAGIILVALRVIQHATDQASKNLET